MTNTLKDQEEWLEKAVSDGHINDIKFKKFTNPKKIGKGGYATVYKYEWKDCKLTVALKRIEVDKDLNKNIVDDFVSELKLLQKVDSHPNVIAFHGVTKDENGYYNMVLQYANEGNLREYLRLNFTRLQWPEKFLIAKEAALGLLFLHENNIIHRDLHSKNILIHQGHPKIADFGLSKQINEMSLTSKSAVHGMPSYISYIEPEYIYNSKYKRDIKSEMLNQLIKDLSQLITNEPLIKFLQNTSLQWFPFNNLQIIKEIGKGGFATVFLAKCNLNGSTENVALKFLRGSRNNFEALLKELNVYYSIGCKEPTFLQCYGISKDINTTNDYILVMQYAPMGSLRQNLHKVAKIVWKEKLELLSYIALDLKMMHSHSIIHRDLHSGNILQNNLYNAYIGDLGLAETINNALAKSNGIYGVFPYIAPEVLRRRGYTPASDVYSFGIIMWEVSSGRLAFSDKNHDLFFLTEVCNGLRPTVAKDMPQNYVDLMKRCWDNDPEKRPTASEIYEVIESWKNNYEILLKFNKFEIILEESGIIHPQAVYTSRFISLKELMAINSQAVCTNEIIIDNNKIIESQENNKIIESREDNIPIERMNKLMLK